MSQPLTALGPTPLARGLSLRLLVSASALSLFSIACGSSDPPPEPPPAGDDSCAASELPGDIELGAWDDRFTVAGLAGHDGIGPTVYDFTRDADGALVAVGYFQYAGSQRVEPFLRRTEDGTWEPVRTSWELEVPRGGFSAVAIGPGGQLALATNAGAFGGTTREIWLDTGSGLQVIGHVDGPVRSLAWFDGALWVAGTFTLMEGGIPQLAVYDGATWAPPPGGALNGNAYRLMAEEDRIFVTGLFDSVGGVQARNVAAYDGVAWEAYDLDALTTVYAIARSPQGELVAGGYTLFEAAGGVYRRQGATWEPVGTGVSLGPVSDVTGVVTDLAFHDGDLYITGCFDVANGPASTPGALPLGAPFARWDGAAWVPLDDVPAGEQPTSPWLNFAVCGFDGPYSVYDVRHQRLFSHGQRLYAGGSFAGAGDVASQSVIAFDGQRWDREGAPAGLGINGYLRDFAVGGPDCALHAVGRMSHIAGEPSVSGVVRYEPEGFREIGSALPEGVSCEHIGVNAAGTVLLGCIAEADAFQLLEMRDGAWEVLGELSPGEEGRLVWDMELDPSGRPWVVGLMAGTGGVDSGLRGFVARWDDDHFTVVEDRFDGMVARVDFSPRDGDAFELVIGGSFTRLGDEPMRGVARWNGTAFEAIGGGVDGLVQGLEVGREAIYVSTQPVDDAPGRVYRFDGSAWVDIADVEAGYPTFASVTQLQEIGTMLVASGSMGIVNGPGTIESDRRNVYTFDGARWESLAGGVAAPMVSAAAYAAGSLWFGGEIAEVGPNGGLVSSVGVARFGWAQ